MIHLQSNVPAWDEALAILPPGALVKTVDQAHEHPFIKNTNPGLYTCLRHHYDTNQVFGGTLNEAKDRARQFFRTFIDETFINKYAAYTDFVEEWNEYLANSQNDAELRDRFVWAEAAAHVWLHEYRRQYPQLSHIRLVLCNAAVGNWIHRTFGEIANLYDCLIGYHPYDYWRHKERGEEGIVAGTSMLWDTMELDWKLKPDWIFTEAGPFESAVTGWRASECLGFDRELYYEALATWLEDVKQIPAYRDGRIFGFALFTTGRTHEVWKSYWTEQPELNQLAQLVCLEWKPGQGQEQQEALYRFLWEQSISKQAIKLNRDAALQRLIFKDGFVPVMGEFWTTFDGFVYAIQAAENLYTGERRVYFAAVPQWNEIRYITNVPEEEATA